MFVVGVKMFGTGALAAGDEACARGRERLDLWRGETDIVRFERGKWGDQWD